MGCRRASRCSPERSQAVSDPVYRIEVEHDPNELVPWYSRVYRVSDDAYMSGSTQVADSSEEAVQLARQWIATDKTRQDGFTVYADECGEIVQPLHSVKA